jgi:hypothetical protein
MPLNLDPTILTTTLIGESGLTGAPPVVTEVNGVPVAAILELQATDGALLLPRMTTTEMNALSPVVDGMVIYNTTVPGVYYRQNGAWSPSSGGSGTGTVTSISVTGPNLDGGTITTTGTISLSSALFGLVSVDIGTINISGSTITSSDTTFAISANALTSHIALVANTSILLSPGTLGAGTVDITDGSALRLYNNANTQFVAIKALSTLTTSATYIWPSTAPVSNNQVLASTTGGTMSWQSLGTGSVTSITAGSNLSATPNPITTSGTISLANTLSGLTSVTATTGVFGNITLATRTLTSSAGLDFSAVANITLSGALAVTQSDFVIANGHALTLNNVGNGFKTSFVCNNTSANQSYTLPLAGPVSNGQVLASTTGGQMSWVTAAGSVTSISQGLNMVCTPNPITSTGTVALSTTLTGITSAVIGGATYNSSGVSMTGTPYQITGEGIGLSGLGATNSYILTDCPVRIPADGASTANQGLQLAIGSFALSLYSGNSSANQFYVFPATDPSGTQVLTGVVSAGKVIMSWGSVGGGTVTSVTATSPNLTGGTITGTGSIGLNPVLTAITSAAIGGHAYSASGMAATTAYAFTTSTGSFQIQPANGFTTDVLSNLRLMNLGGTPSSIQLLDLTAKIVSFKAPNALTQNTAYTLPIDFPAVSGYHLASTTAGVMSWTADTGAANTLKFLVQQADGSIPNAQAMGALATGIVKNTTTTGVQSIAVAGTDYYAPNATYALKLNNVGGTPNANLYLEDTSNAPTTPVGGGAFYVQGGALLYIGSNGTVTTIAPA